MHNSDLSHCYPHSLTRVEPEVVNSFSSVFPIAQVIPVSNLRPLSSLVFILWRFEISDYPVCHLGFVMSQHSQEFLKVVI